MNDDFDNTQSKSAYKREATSLQELGTKLMALTSEQLARLPLNESLQAGLAEARRIRSQEARRRHASYIGRLVRETNHYQIEDALAALTDPLRQQRLQDWLQRLAADAAQLAAVFDEIMHTYPFANRQQLRQLLRHFVAAVPIDPANATKGEQEKFKRERRRTHQHLYQLDQQAPLY